MMLLWLSQHPTLGKAKRFSIRDPVPGLKSSAGNIENPEEGRKAHTLLAYNHVYTFWRKWRYIRATRSVWRKWYIWVDRQGVTECTNKTLKLR